VQTPNKLFFAVLTAPWQIGNDIYGRAIRSLGTGNVILKGRITAATGLLMFG
jgi:hypothetical protein